MGKAERVYNRDINCHNSLRARNKARIRHLTSIIIAEILHLIIPMMSHHAVMRAVLL